MKTKEADGIRVHCSFTKVVNIETVTPNPRNPNQHSKEQIELLAKIIKAQGWRAPITVSNRSGYIVRGHGRLAAAQLLGLTLVPIDTQDYASEGEEWADLIADNRIAELAKVDDKLLLDLIAELDTGELDMELTGYSDKDIQKMIEEMTEEWDKKLPPPDPLPLVVQTGDIWKLGSHRVICGGDDQKPLLKELAKEILVSSGSAILACDKAGRRFFVIEPDAEMCEAVLRRWEAFSRRKAVKVSGQQQQSDA